MLVLTRLENERVIIRVPGQKEPIVVVVASLRSAGKVRLAFDAPPDITIDREEVDEAKQSETRYGRSGTQ